MKREEFKQLVLSRPVILDGATGTQLALRGMPAGVCPELWVLDNPDSIVEIQKAYKGAGSDIVYACTFGGNRIKLEEFGAGDRVLEVNRDLALLSRKAMGDGYVFGDVAPTGKFVQPFGDMPFEDSVNIYKEQVKGLLEGGVDGFAIETMMDVQEARAAVIAVRESCDLPVIVTMTFGEDGRTLTGTEPLTALITLQALGVDAFGCNCSLGPDRMLEWLRDLKPYATVPLVAKPNAGMPKLVDGETVFDMGAEEFGSFAPKLVEAGVNILGGCCGTTPDHIRVNAQAASACKPVAPAVSAISAVSSARSVAFPGLGRPLVVVGERINPTGKKLLKAELREGKLDLVRKYAAEQAEDGADILDVNMGVSGIDEREMMEKAICLLSQISDKPLCIDSPDPKVIETALRLYPGRALVNSVSGEAVKLEKVLPLAAKYGAMFILLPLDDDAIPETCAGRIEVFNRVFAEAQKYGFEKEDVTVDGLVMAVSADPAAAKETLNLISWCASDAGVNTILGLSNISFGMPSRKWLNSSFLSMAIDRGLSMTIANPASAELMASRFASDALKGRDVGMTAYVSRFADAGKSDAPAKKTVEMSPKEKVFQAVLKGEQDSVQDTVRAALDSGVKAQELVDESLIPAIAKVGDLFDAKKYFLPQLMMSADTMKKAFVVLEPLLKADGDGEQKSSKFVIATVKGDIHDIGKNLVALMLRNYGFDVIDLGKDVDAEDIVGAAKEHDAPLVGLSALMTTTMTEMKTVVDLAKKEKLSTKFMIGGAVVDQAYADLIGADGYSPDAISAVRLAKKLLE